jgi:hypothetical protein
MEAWMKLITVALVGTTALLVGRHYFNKWWPREGWVYDTEQERFVPAPGRSGEDYERWEREA